ncbi:hypothetical protein EP331_12810 [bacterium]|nr:MAG: hypothetical protein EP331_12810 [bacterium]
MTGIAQNQYPLIVFEKQEKRVFNPLTKKRLVLRPEEIVRLQWVETLQYVYAIKKSRISCEQAVLTAYQDKTLRADLVVYDEQFKPMILIECKSNQVELSSQTALQAGVYNTTIEAPFILITNGIHDVWFEKTESGWKTLAHAPLQESHDQDFKLDADYWIERGFIGKLIDRERVKLLLPFLSHLYHKSGNLIRYRAFSQAPDNHQMNHFYASILSGDSLYHTSFLADFRGKSSWWTLVTKNGVNEQLIYVDVDAAFADIHPHVWVYQKGKRLTGSLPVDFFISMSPFDSPQKICDSLVHFSSSL